MSSEYQRKWRRRRAKVDSLVEYDSSSESEGSVEPALAREGSPLTEGSTHDELHPMVACSSSVSTAVVSIRHEEEYNYDTDSTETESEQLDEASRSIVETPSLHKDLASWATATNQTHKALNELLDVLRRHGHRLPKDARTLLETPQGVPVQNKCSGQYIYYGIERYVLEHFSKETLPGNVELCFNVDGVPLFKSSKMCFWPILGQIQNFQPFIVALYHGSSKPDSVEDFLQDFLEELQQLIQNGISFQNSVHTITVKAIICDAQARSFLKCIKGHNSLHGCERCVAVAQKIEGRIVYLTKRPAEKRRDDVFNQAGYPDHQKQISPLVKAGILCVKQFPLDYMHLVCLGAMKRLLTYLWRGPDICRLSKAQRKQVELNIGPLKGALPAEFSRQPRSMEDLDRWKATELRHFMLYTGPLILKDVLPDDQYHHFLCLSVGMNILLDEADGKRESYLGYAHSILEHFVDHSVDFYGPTFPTYNIHSVKHLSDDAVNFHCSLNHISCFPFENHLQVIKKMVRSGKQPLVQVTKRLAERQCTETNAGRYQSTTKITSKMPDNCVLLMDNAVGFIREKRSDGTLRMDVIGETDCDSIFEKPCNSKLFNIMFVSSDLTAAKRMLTNRASVYKKAVCLPYKQGYAIFPQLHKPE